MTVAGMAAIRRRDRDGEWWVDFRYRHRRVRRRSPEQSRRGAEAFERVLRREFIEDEDSGRNPFAGPPPLLEDFADRWFREYVESTNRPSSRNSKRMAFQTHILPAFGRLRLDEITPARIDAFSAEKTRAGLRPKTVNNLLSILRCTLTTATEWGELRAVPKVRRLKVPTPPYRYLTTTEATSLLAAAPEGFWRTLILFLLHTGCRFGEAAALEWDDLELEGPAPVAHIRRAVWRSIVGPTKTGRVRDVPLTPELARALAAYRHDGARVFQLRDGRYPSPESSHKYLARFCGHAGIRPIGWHALRHTYATELTARGAPLRAVQELLGHTSILMTARYAHVAPTTLRSAVALLSTSPQAA